MSSQWTPTRVSNPTPALVRDCHVQAAGCRLPAAGATNPLIILLAERLEVAKKMKATHTVLAGDHETVGMRC